MKLRSSKVLPPRRDEDSDSILSDSSRRTSSSQTSLMTKIEKLRALDKEQERMRAEREQLMLDIETRSRGPRHSSRSSRMSVTSRREVDDRQLKMNQITVEAQVETPPKIKIKPTQMQLNQNHVAEPQVPHERQYDHFRYKMADNIVSSGTEDNYGFNLEWIAEGSGIGEEICGVDKDCIVVPTSPMIPKMENCDTDYIEIQVTEEEVIAGQWDENTDGVGELEVCSLSQDVLVPLDEEQDEYSRLHPYPCDFCSRRFSKQSSITVHMPHINEFAVWLERRAL